MVWRSPRVQVATVLVGALILRLWRLGDESYWVDEIHSINVARMPWADIVTFEDEHPTFYYLLLKAWMAMFGSSPWGTRSLSVAASVALLAVVYEAARRTWHHGPALVATALLAISSFQIRYAQETRMYALLGLLALLSWYLLLRTRTGGPWRWAYAATAAAMLYTHVYGYFVYVGQLIWWALVHRHPRAMARNGWAILPGIAALPWALFTLRERAGNVSDNFWLPPLDWAGFADTLARWYGGRLPAAIVVALLLSGAVILARRLARAERPLDRLTTAHAAWWIAWIAPATIAVAISLAWTPVFHSRYVMPSAVVAMMCAVRVGWSMPRNVRAAVLGALLVLTGAQAAVWMEGPHRTSWEDATAYLDAEVALGGTVVFYQGFCDSTRDDDLQCGVEFYSDRTDWDLVAVPPPYVYSMSPHDLEALQARLGNGTVWLVHTHLGGVAAVVASLEASGLVRADIVRIDGVAIHRFDPAP